MGLTASGIGREFVTPRERVIAGLGATRIIDECREYCDQVERGEVEPPKTDANGNIISSPSTRKPDVFDGLDLFIPAEIA